MIATFQKWAERHVPPGNVWRTRTGDRINYLFLPEGFAANFSQAENKHFRPPGGRCTDSRELWQDQGARVSA